MYTATKQSDNDWLFYHKPREHGVPLLIYSHNRNVNRHEDAAYGKSDTDQRHLHAVCFLLIQAGRLKSCSTFWIENTSRTAFRPSENSRIRRSGFDKMAAGSSPVLIDRVTTMVYAGRSRFQLAHDV